MDILKDMIIRMLAMPEVKEKCQRNAGGAVVKMLRAYCHRVICNFRKQQQSR